MLQRNNSDKQLIHEINIGKLRLANNIFMAPLAGVTDKAFRILAHDGGAGLGYTEMISAKGVHYNSKGSKELAEVDAREGTTAVQIFGSEPEILAEAARLFVDRGAPMIDINMGCPMKKVTSNGDGSALLNNPDLVYKIIRAVKNAIDVPVTVKMRRGFEIGRDTDEAPLAAAEAGVDAITLHGRYRDEYYSGASDYDYIARMMDKIRQNTKSTQTKTPILIANGDITDGKSAYNALTQTGADAIMIGRGALGNPWIFTEITNELTGDTVKMSKEQRLERTLTTMKRHIDLAVEFKGEHIGIPELRKHIQWYVKGLPGSAACRADICTATTKDEMVSMIERFFESVHSAFDKGDCSQYN